MTRILLLDVRDAEERRAALLEDGALSMLWTEREDDRSLVGNVYLGRVVRIEPSIGAAFVDLGLDRPGFLPADDTVPREVEAEENGAGAHRAAGGAEPAMAAVDPASPDEPGPAARTDSGRRIEETMRTGDPVVVQVSRDAVARKGPTLTRHVSFAGRTLVLLPSLGRVAVSRRIPDPEARRRIEDRIRALALPPEVGVVARTACEAATDAELAADAAVLVAAWERVRDGGATLRAPALLHAESDFVTRAVRELAVRAPEGSEGPLRIVADTAECAARARELCARMEPAAEVVLHDSPMPLFHAFGVESAVRALDDPRAPLPGGASIVIHETEAMWTIDVNSGRLRSAESLEETALATDLLAAREVARQIRLRDLSGLIVVDFIDCREQANRDAVEAALRTELAKDAAKMRTAALSEFMVAEITRRRMRSGPARSGSQPCPACGGRGRIRTAESAALAAIRDVRACFASGAGGGVEIVATPAVAAALELRRAEMSDLETRHGARVVVRTAAGTCGDRFDVRRV